MANDSGIGTALGLPKAIAISPLSRMLAAVNIDGNWRRFYGIQRPQPTDPSTATETYEYSEGSVELPGATTAGNVALVFTHNPEGLIDDFLKTKLQQNLSLRFYTRGDLIHPLGADIRLVITAEETTDGFDKGLSELKFGTVVGTTITDLTQAAQNELVENGYIREGAVVQYITTPTEITGGPDAATAGNQDLTIIEQPMVDADGNYKLYTKGRALSEGIEKVNGATDLLRYTMEIYNPSTVWEVAGPLLTYSPQFDQAARAARIEITRNTESDKQIRYEDSQKAFTQAA